MATTWWSASPPASSRVSSRNTRRSRWRRICARCIAALTRVDAMTVLLVHGAWQGSWAWERLTPLLLEAGLDVQLLDLPGNGSDDTDPADVSLDLYVAAVKRHLSEIQGGVSIVAHS